MSYIDGMAAIHLEMPDKVPRTEYSADFHWELIQTVTGIPVHENSPAEVNFGLDMMLQALGIDAAAFGETANRYAKLVSQLCISKL